MVIATKDNSSKEKDMELAPIEIARDRSSLMEDGLRTNLFKTYDFYFIIK